MTLMSSMLIPFLGEACPGESTSPSAATAADSTLGTALSRGLWAIALAVWCGSFG